MEISHQLTSRLKDSGYWGYDKIAEENSNFSGEIALLIKAVAKENFEEAKRHFVYLALVTTPHQERMAAWDLMGFSGPIYFVAETEENVELGMRELFSSIAIEIEKI